MSSSDALRQENEQLKEELKVWRSRFASTTSRLRYDELENERDALREENQLKQKTIEALQDIVRYEKLKSKDWSRHSNSSLSAAVSGRRRRPCKSTKADGELDTASLVDSVRPLRTEQLFKKPISPVQNMHAPVKSPTSLAQICSEQDPRAFSIEDSMNENALSPPLPSTDTTKNSKRPLSFANFDPTYLQPDFSSHVTPRTSPGLESIAPKQRLFNLSPPNKRSSHSVGGLFRFGSTFLPWQSYHTDEHSEEKQYPCSLPDALEAVGVRTTGQRTEESGTLPEDVKLGSGYAGSAKDANCVESEGSQRTRTPTNTTSGMMLILEGGAGKTVFKGPRENRNQQPLAAQDVDRILYLADSERVGPEPSNSNAQPLKALSSWRNDGMSRESQQGVHPKPLREIENDQRIPQRTIDTAGSLTKKRKATKEQELASISITAENAEGGNQCYKKTATKFLMPLCSPCSNMSGFPSLDSPFEELQSTKSIPTKPALRTSSFVDGSLLDAAAPARSAKKNELDTLYLNGSWTWEGHKPTGNLSDPFSCQRTPQSRNKLTQKSSGSHAATPKDQHEPQRRFLTGKRKSLHGREDEEPFRSRSVERLNLEHFKINPEANAGIDYAYLEVIRSRDQRKCLPGCIRPGCCGSKFRALADTLPWVTANSAQSIGADSSCHSTSRKSDDDLLYDFLGPGSEEKIRTLTQIARENLLLEAKTKIATDKYGKLHRHMHERHKSPPGFWRAEMPGTQEEAFDRLDAKNKEREEVERRYVEASKEGGRWMFADE